MEENDHHENKQKPRDFDQVVNEFKKTSKQPGLIAEEVIAFGKIWLSLVAFCFFVFAAYLVWHFELSVFYLIVAIPLALFCLYFAYGQFMASNEKVRSRDRILFLRCIQAAQSVDELDQLGFFRVRPCRTGDEYKKDRDSVAKKMGKTFSSRS